MIGIVDYGVGNLFSLKSSFAFIGEEAVVTGDRDILHECERIILPGVGAFGDAVLRLKSTGIFDAVKEEASSGKPLLGICLGMQLLFDKSYEYGEYEGLGLIPGSVKDIRPVIGEGLKVPHIGWNALIFPKGRDKSMLYKYTDEGDCVYFVHSYAAMDCDEYITATAEYGALLTASAENGNVYGTQFHPEKSGNVGLAILRAFCEI